MSATPTLVPDPAVIAVQSMIFLTAVVLVKKYMLDPYDRLRNIRTQQTSGSSEKAKSLLLRNTEVTSLVDKSINDTIAEAKSAAEGVRKRWQSERDQIVGDAETEATRQADSAIKQLQIDLVTQEAQISQEAIKLSKLIVDALKLN